MVETMIKFVEGEIAALEEQLQDDFSVFIEIFAEGGKEVSEEIVGLIEPPISEVVYHIQMKKQIVNMLKKKESQVIDLSFTESRNELIS